MFDYSCHGSLSGARARFLTRCLLLVAALAARAAAAGRDAQGLRFFDIPALPLAEALQRFTASTGHSGLYDSGLVAGRRSRVAGHYTAESALRLMLGDSGLQARYGSPDTFTLAAVATAAPGPAETLAARRRYHGKLQAAMRALLCGDPDVRPGSYRAAVSLWFGDSGQVRRVRLLDSTVRPSAISC